MNRQVLLALAFAAALASAQTLTQKIDVSVVNVDVVVTAPDGAPVRGLTRDDFLLFEDGVAQPITNFYSVENTPRPVEGAEQPAHAVAVPDDERFRRKVLVLIDNNHLSKRGRELALKNLEELINDRFRGGEYEWSIAGIGSHVGLAMPLTSDKKQIHAALEAIRSGGRRSDRPEFNDIASQSISSTDLQAVQWSAMNRTFSAARTFSQDKDDLERSMQARYTTDAIVEAARAFAGAGGKKIVLLLTDDIGLNDIETSFVTPFSIQQRNINEWSANTAKTLQTLKNRIIEEANASNASFYIINPEGLTASNDIGANPKPETNNQAVYWLAEQTGGKLLPGNDLKTSVQRFDDISSNYYSLGFRPAHPDDGKYHALTVKLAKPGNYKLQHRMGYTNLTTDAQLGRALQSHIAVTMATNTSALPVTLTTEATESADRRDAVVVPFSAKIPMSSLQFVPAGDQWKARMDIYVSVFDENGRNIVLKRFTAGASAASADPDPNGVFVYKNKIALRKGQTHRIVVAIRDQATDAVGMADRTVKF